MDRYTKLLLTVIALALVWIAAKPSVPAAYADATAPIVCTLPQTMDMNIAAVGGEPLEGRPSRQSSATNKRIGLPMFDLTRVP